MKSEWGIANSFQQADCTLTSLICNTREVLISYVQDLRLRRENERPLLRFNLAVSIFSEEKNFDAT